MSQVALKDQGSYNPEGTQLRGAEPRIPKACELLEYLSAMAVGFELAPRMSQSTPWVNRGFV